MEINASFVLTEALEMQRIKRLDVTFVLVMDTEISQKVFVIKRPECVSAKIIPKAPAVNSVNKVTLGIQPTVNLAIEHAIQSN